MKNPRLIVIFTTVFIDLVGFGIVIPLSPYLASHFNAGPFEIGLLMSCYSLMQFLFSPIWGKLSDRIGRRPVMLVSIFGSAVSYLAFAFADSYAGLFLARIFAGIATANISTAMAYIADITDAKDRSKSMGLIGAAFGLGFVVGPALGGILTQIGNSLGDQPPFGMSFSAVGAALICFLNFCVAFFRLEESFPLEKRQAAAGGWSAVTGSSGKGAAAHQIKRDGRLKVLYLGFVKPILGQLLFVYFLSGLAMACMESTLALYLKDKFQWSAVKASYMFAVVGIFMALCQGVLIRRLLPKFGERQLALVGCLFGSLGMGLLGLSTSFLMLAAAIFFVTIGVSFVSPTINGSISLLTSSDHQGGVMGQSQSLSALGRILGPLIGGFFYQRLHQGMPFFTASLFYILGALTLLSVFSRLPDSRI